MNVDEFFSKYSLEEINKKTKISINSLKLIKNKEFDKLPRVKFIGFIRLIEKKFNVNLDEIIEEYENFFRENGSKKEEKNENVEIKENKSYLWILFFILFFVSGILYFNSLNKASKIENNKSINVVDNNIEENLNENIEISEINETNETNETNSDNLEAKSIKNLNEVNESNKSISKKNVKESNITKEYNITILPHKLVWFKVKNLDNNKTKEFLTTKMEVLKGNYYIKFGHGDITILYNDKNITPNTKKIVRILFKDGNYTFLKKHNEYEK